jgi:hypothetical protein
MAACKAAKAAARREATNQRPYQTANYVDLSDSS